MAKKFISITEARQKLFKIAEEVQEPNMYYILTINGRPEVSVMSSEEFDSIKNSGLIFREEPKKKYRVRKRKK